MKSGRWSNSEHKTLANLYPIHSLDQISQIMKRPVSTIKRKCWILGLRGKERRKIPMTPEFKLWMKLNYPHLSTSLIALKYGISYKTVTRMAKSLGLAKSKEFIRSCSVSRGKKSALSENFKGYENLMKGRGRKAV